MQNQALIRRNIIMMTLEGTFFWAGLSFLQADTVVSGFINATTGSVALVGLAATLRSLLYLVGNFFMGMVIHRLRSQQRAMAVIGVIDRCLILLMLPVLLCGVEGKPAGWIFIALYAVMFLLDGLVSLCWMEISTRTLPVAKRGVVVQLQQTLSGLIGLGAGWVLRAVLGSELSFRHQYSVIFGLAGAMFLINCFFMCNIRDLPDPTPRERPPIPALGKYLRELVSLFAQDRPVRRVLYSRMLYLLTLISAPINILFGSQMGGLSAAQMNWLVFMPIIGQIVAGVLWAQVGSRLGYPIMMLMAEIVGVVTALTNLACFFIARAGLPVFMPLCAAMILVAINTPAYNAFYQHMVVIVPQDKRPEYIVMAALVLAPLSLGTFIAGVIVENWGFLPVYFIMLAGGVLGFIMVYKHFIRGSVTTK